MNQLYLLVLLFSVIVPFAFSFHPKLKFYHYFKDAALAILTVALPFVAWDIYFTANTVWGFNPNYISGIFFYNLPLEEVLFFFCIPFCCLFTHYSIKKIMKRNFIVPYAGAICIISGACLFFTGCMLFEKMYTLWTFTLAGLTLVLFGIKNPPYISKFIISYFILLIPFFIVNGILTGTGPEHPVVWYNNEENLHLRILTIPVEDFFYGMVLILWNIILFELLSKKTDDEKQA